MKLINSIRSKPVNFILMIVVVALYFFNNLYLKAVTSNQVKLFFKCYFNDLLCPLFLLAYSNLLLLTVQKEIKRLKWTLVICFLAGLVWEFFAPFIKFNAVADVFDLICYLIGGFIYWGMLSVYDLLSSQRRNTYD